MVRTTSPEAWPPRIAAYRYGPLEAASLEALPSGTPHFHRARTGVLDPSRTAGIVLEESVPNGEKIFSLFEPHTELPQAGQGDQPIEFGHMIQIQQVEAKFITGLTKSLTRSPSSTNSSSPTLRRHKELFGQYPQELSADKGYYENMDPDRPSGKDYRDGRHREKGRRTQEQIDRETDPAFRHAQRFRAGVEGTNLIPQEGPRPVPLLQQGLGALRRHGGRPTVLAPQSPDPGRLLTAPPVKTNGYAASQGSAQSTAPASRPRDRRSNRETRKPQPNPSFHPCPPNRYTPCRCSATNPAAPADHSGNSNQLATQPPAVVFSPAAFVATFAEERGLDLRQFAWGVHGRRGHTAGAEQHRFSTTTHARGDTDRARTDRACNSNSSASA